MSRTRFEIVEELHSLNQLTIQPEILAHDTLRDDLAVVDSLRAQIHVIEHRLTYSEVLHRYEDSDEPGAEYILGAAFDAFRWLHEDDEAPSARWREVLDDLALVSPDPVSPDPATPDHPILPDAAPPALLCATL